MKIISAMPENTDHSWLVWRLRPAGAQLNSCCSLRTGQAGKGQTTGVLPSGSSGYVQKFMFPLSRNTGTTLSCCLLLFVVIKSDNYVCAGFVLTVQLQMC